MQSLMQQSLLMLGVPPRAGPSLAHHTTPHDRAPSVAIGTVAAGGYWSRKLKHVLADACPLWVTLRAEQADFVYSSGEILLSGAEWDRLPGSASVATRALDCGLGLTLALDVEHDSMHPPMLRGICLLCASSCLAVTGVDRPVPRWSRRRTRYLRSARGSQPLAGTLRRPAGWPGPSCR